MSFDVLSLRREFPLSTTAGTPLHYLDSAATSQIHRCALERMILHETRQRANVMRGTHRLSEAATEAYDEARTRVGWSLPPPQRRRARRAGDPAVEG